MLGEPTLEVERQSGASKLHGLGSGRAPSRFFTTLSPGTTQTRVTSQRPIQLEWTLGQGHARRWFITVIECLQSCYSVSRAEEKKEDP